MSNAAPVTSITDRPISPTSNSRPAVRAAGGDAVTWRLWPRVEISAGSRPKSTVATIVTTNVKPRTRGSSVGSRARKLVMVGM